VKPPFKTGIHFCSFLNDFRDFICGHELVCMFADLIRHLPNSLSSTPELIRVLLPCCGLFSKNRYHLSKSVRQDVAHGFDRKPKVPVHRNGCDQLVNGRLLVPLAQSDVDLSVAFPARKTHGVLSVHLAGQTGDIGLNLEIRFSQSFFR
jgi:hypothetical protein